MTCSRSRWRPIPTSSGDWGGGGNFGVVTELVFDAHPLGPEVAFLFALYPLESARHVLAEHERIVDAGGDEVSTIVVLGYVPPIDDFPAELHEAPYAGVLGVYAGPADDGEAALRPLRELGELLVDLSGPMQFVDVQKIYDPDYPAGQRYYWKSTNLAAITGDAVDALAERMQAAPSKHSTIDIWLNGGAIDRITSANTAFAGRGTRYVVNPEADWEDATDDEANISWARAC